MLIPSFRKRKQRQLFFLTNRTKCHLTWIRNIFRINILWDKTFYNTWSINKTWSFVFTDQTLLHFTLFYFIVCIHSWKIVDNYSFPSKKGGGKVFCVFCKGLRGKICFKVGKWFRDTFLWYINYRMGFTKH